MYSKKYKVSILRLSEPFSVGIERYNDEEVEWVGSYYLPNHTRRTVTNFILKKINSQLKDGEKALVRINDKHIKFKPNWYSNYSAMDFQFYSFPKFPSSLRLANDALVTTKNFEKHTKIKNSPYAGLNKKRSDNNGLQ